MLCFYTCLSVILFPGGSIWAGTPLDQVHPQQVHHLGPGTHPGRYTPQTRYTPLAGTCPSRSTQLGPGTHPPRTRYTPQAGTPPGPGTPPRTRYPPQQTATVADGMHPTGMHSCFMSFTSKSVRNIKL